MDPSPLFQPAPAKLFSIAIPGVPVGAARPRVVRLKTGASHTFIPDGPAKWEGLALELIGKVWRLAPLDEPLSLDVLAIHQRPQKWCRKRDPKGRIPATCKPDGDNVLKLVMDTLTKAAVIRDDTRICRGLFLKLYQAIDRNDPPAVYIRLRPFTVPS